jgi:hypothetical protein
MTACKCLLVFSSNGSLVELEIKIEERKQCSEFPQSAEDVRSVDK